VLQASLPLELLQPIEPLGPKPFELEQLDLERLGLEQLVFEHPGLNLRLQPRWLDHEQADALLQELLGNVAWKQEHIRLFGRVHPLPRLTCWIADPGCAYRYSGLQQVVEPWTPALQALRIEISEFCGCAFNSLLLNLYRHGRDAMGCHADDEPELEASAAIASLSLGSRRTLRFKPKSGSGLAAQSQSFALELNHGDLLVMDPPTQQHWLHGLPRRTRIESPRINLTFRRVRG